MVALVLAIGLAACGGSMTLTEYASRLEQEVTAMNARIDEVDAQLEQPASVDEARRSWDDRVAARERFLHVLEELDPPKNAAEMHAAAIDIMGRLAAAEAALGARAADYGTVVDLGQIWDTTEGRAARAVDEEAVGICRAAQAEFDETADREILADVSWMTSEMKEVVAVVFGCTREERGGAP